MIHQKKKKRKGKEKMTDFIKPTFPPKISAEELAKKQIKNNVRNVNRTINGFFIYRIIFDRLNREVILKTGDVSKFAGKSWRQEPLHVKEYYKKIAEDVKYHYKRHVPLTFVDMSKQTEKKIRKGKKTNVLTLTQDIDNKNVHNVYHAENEILTAIPNYDILCQCPLYCANHSIGTFPYFYDINDEFNYFCLNYLFKE